MEAYLRKMGCMIKSISPESNKEWRGREATESFPMDYEDSAIVNLSLLPIHLQQLILYRLRCLKKYVKVKFAMLL